MQHDTDKNMRNDSIDALLVKQSRSLDEVLNYFIICPKSGIVLNLVIQIIEFSGLWVMDL